MSELMHRILEAQKNKEYCRLCFCSKKLRYDCLKIFNILLDLLNDRDVWEWKNKYANHQQFILCVECLSRVKSTINVIKMIKFGIKFDNIVKVNKFSQNFYTLSMKTYNDEYLEIQKRYTLISTATLITAPTESFYKDTALDEKSNPYTIKLNLDKVENRTNILELERSKGTNLTQNKDIIPQKKIIMPQKATMPQNKIRLPEKKLPLQKNDVVKNLIMPQNNVMMPQNNISISQSNVLMQQNNVIMPQSNIIMPENNLMLPQSNMILIPMPLVTLNAHQIQNMPESGPSNIMPQIIAQDTGQFNNVNSNTKDSKAPEKSIIRVKNPSQLNDTLQSVSENLVLNKEQNPQKRKLEYKNKNKVNKQVTKRNKNLVSISELVSQRQSDKSVKQSENSESVSVNSKKNSDSVDWEDQIPSDLIIFENTTDKDKQETSKESQSEDKDLQIKISSVYSESEIIEIDDDL